MSELDVAMLQYIHFIICSEYRPFSYKDFLKFVVNGREYGMAHGTFRNKISKLISTEKVEVSYYSSCAFYTLRGHTFGKLMTPDHMGIQNNPLYKMLQELPFEKQSIHDIRLRFKVLNIWKMFSDNPNFATNGRSKDILIPSWARDKVIVRVIIHKTDTVSVIIGCTLHPIPLDINGIIHFFNLLVRVEEKLQTVLDNSTPINYDIKNDSIPEYKSWIVTMWHFGRDALVGFTDKKFCVTLEKAQHILTRLYVKDFKGKNKVRIEKQEYPKKTVLEAIEDKLVQFS